MSNTAVLVPAVLLNVIVWWIYLVADNPGFPWPVFITLASIFGLIAQYRRPQARAGAGRQRNRARNRDRKRDRG